MERCYILCGFKDSMSYQYTLRLRIGNYLRSTKEIMSLRDWRQALTAPPMYRVGNSALRIQPLFVGLVTALGLLVLIVWYSKYSGHDLKFKVENSVYPNFKDKYNDTYPLTNPIVNPSGTTYRIGIIADLDTDSLSIAGSSTWVSYFKKGYLTWDPVGQTAHVAWDAEQPTVLKTSLGQGGRGMELSELVVFNGRLYAPDDRTGVVYEVEGSNVRPWVILPAGNGWASKGFKSEWAAVKDQTLFIGSLGKEWTTARTGEVINYDPMWIKTISPYGQVMHHDWRSQYLKLRESVGIQFPGYMIHECAVWSKYHKKWFFLPRRSSKASYHEDDDSYQGTNLLLTTDSHFSNVEVVEVGEVIPTHGFSSFKFIPGTKDEVIVALKTEEVKQGTATYIMVFTIKGEILLPETKVAKIKYEGIEFI